MAAKQTVELVSKDGKRTWSTDSAVEATNLRAQGWRDKAEPAKPAAPKVAK